MGCQAVEAGEEEMALRVLLSGNASGCKREGMEEAVHARPPSSAQAGRPREELGSTRAGASPCFCSFTEAAPRDGLGRMRHE